MTRHRRSPQDRPAWSSRRLPRRPLRPQRLRRPRCLRPLRRSERHRRRQRLRHQHPLRSRSIARIRSRQSDLLHPRSRLPCPSARTDTFSHPVRTASSQAVWASSPPSPEPTKPLRPFAGGLLRGCSRRRPLALRCWLRVSASQRVLRSPAKGYPAAPLPAQWQSPGYRFLFLDPAGHLPAREVLFAVAHFLVVFGVGVHLPGIELGHSRDVPGDEERGEH